MNKIVFLINIILVNKQNFVFDEHNFGGRTKFIFTNIILVDKQNFNSKSTQISTLTLPPLKKFSKIVNFEQSTENLMRTSLAFL